MVLDTGHGLSSQEQEYNPSPIINELRQEIERWRALSNPEQWQVTPVTATLLRHWRALQDDPTRQFRPFFCQVEAIETAVWLAEVAPKAGQRGRRFLDFLKFANQGANPELFRIAMKLATGAGKTTVMAMLVAWQAINAVRSPNSKTFSRAFLVITPGITIRDRLRVLLPNDESYYRDRGLVPSDVLQRVMADLMALKNVIVINDEAHHCYREKPGADEPKLKGDERKEARRTQRRLASGSPASRR